LVNEIIYNEYKQEFHEYNLPYYSYKHNNKLHILIMSAEHDFEENSEQYRFIEQELKNSKCDWIIVCIHQAAYCSKSRHEPKECNTCSPSTYPTRRYCLAKVYHHSLSEKYHVDLISNYESHQFDDWFTILKTDNNRTS
jgi:hypothetical protein